MWLIKKYEGLRFEAYLDEAGVATIGWGHTKNVNIGQTIDEFAAEVYLLEDLEEAQATVKDLIEVPLVQNQFDALVSFAFNFGRTKFSKSTLRKKLNAGDYESVPHQLTRWRYINIRGQYVASKGLLNRRIAEAKFFKDGTLETEDG